MIKNLVQTNDNQGANYRTSPSRIQHGPSPAKSTSVDLIRNTYLDKSKQAIHHVSHSPLRSPEVGAYSANIAHSIIRREDERTRMTPYQMRNSLNVPHVRYTVYF